MKLLNYKSEFFRVNCRQRGQIKLTVSCWTGKRGEEKFAQGLMVKPEGKVPLGRPRRKCQDNFQMNVSNWGVRKWTGFII